MALRKQILLACALLALSAMLFGCAEDTAAPDQQDEAPVAAPTNVRAALVNGSVLVSWDPSTQATVRGYNVYRRVGDAGPVTRLNTGIVSGTEYIDPSARRGAEYQYRVTAVGGNNRESTFVTIEIELSDPIGDAKVPVPDASL